MNGKEIITAGILLKRTPRPPVMVLSGGVWLNKQYGLSLQDSFRLEPRVNAQNIIETNAHVRSDLLWASAGCNNLGLRGIGARACFSQVGAAATILEPLIENAEDVDKLDVNDMENDPGLQAMLETTRILKEKVGDEYLIGISQWGAFTLAGLLMDTDKLMIMSLKDKQAAEHIFEFTKRLVIKYWSLFVQAGAELVSQAEPSASCNMISPKQFERMVLPLIQDSNAVIGDRVRYKMLHICGDINKLLPILPLTGSDVISYDYPVSLTSSRELLGGKMAFAGKLDPVGLLQSGTPEEVRRVTLDYIEQAGPEGGYIVMPGCDLAPATPLENIRAMSDTAINYRY